MVQIFERQKGEEKKEEGKKEETLEQRIYDTCRKITDPKDVMSIMSNMRTHVPEAVKGDTILSAVESTAHLSEKLQQLKESLMHKINSREVAENLSNLVESFR